MPSPAPGRVRGLVTTIPDEPGHQCASCSRSRPQSEVTVRTRSATWTPRGSWRTGDLVVWVPIAKWTSVPSYRYLRRLRCARRLAQVLDRAMHRRRSEDSFSTGGPTSTDQQSPGTRRGKPCQTARSTGGQQTVFEVWSLIAQATSPEPAVSSEREAPGAITSLVQRSRPRLGTRARRFRSACHFAIGESSGLESRA